jgi:hypothetical protein
MKRLTELLSRLPKSHFVQIQVEGSAEDGETLTACLFERAPEDGWPSWGARFGHPLGSETYERPAGERAYDDRVIWGISSDLNDEGFWTLLESALHKSDPTERQGDSRPCANPSGSDDK